MVEQEHEVWLDRTLHYSLDKFHDEMATKIIWGPSQTLSVWVVDTDSDSEWKIRRDEHFEQLIKERWADRVAVLVVDVVSKHGQGSGSASSCGGCASGVTIGEGSGVHDNVGGSGIDGNVGGSASHGNVGGSVVPKNAEGTSDTCTSPPPPPPSVPDDIPELVDWANLTILPDMEDDGFANAATDEDKVYEAMGFKAVDERAEEAAREAVPIPTMTAEMQSDMAKAIVPVDDNVPEEPMFEWDKDNPDISVGTCYPSMADFRLAVKQHAILNEFELATVHSDKKRFRGNCGSLGCPWIIRARTQHDGSVRIQINKGTHNCASRARVAGTMASQAWVAERAIPLLKRKPTIPDCCLWQAKGSQKVIWKMG
ncbi:hypothetical protein C2845_PM16G05530 [Panicum miliaceum]|uniref:Transposase MuDR plant domain-containing protein n=1 Tax=Panicum miliaceum TaxID=4540 RepID=A0A3L6PUP1_PANMI|nr:hypothetical protein C2845_PM16G05530 [Panicum miliaceum]